MRRAKPKIRLDRRALRVMGFAMRQMDSTAREIREEMNHA